MDPLFLEEKWYRTNWNYFLTPHGVFVLRLILFDKEWIYFYGFVYDKDNHMQRIVFKSDNDELKRLINAQTNIFNGLTALRCTEHTRLLLYNFFCTTAPTANNKEMEELDNVVSLILA